MNEQNRDLVRIVGLQEVDPRSDLPQERVDVEVPELCVLHAEAWIAEVGDRAIHGHLVEAHEELLRVRASRQFADVVRHRVQLPGPEPTVVVVQMIAPPRSFP